VAVRDLTRAGLFLEQRFIVEFQMALATRWAGSVRKLIEDNGVEGAVNSHGVDIPRFSAVLAEI
jgi:hypothetical protein